MLHLKSLRSKTCFSYLSVFVFSFLSHFMPVETLNTVLGIQLINYYSYKLFHWYCLICNKDDKEEALIRLKQKNGFPTRESDELHRNLPKAIFSNFERKKSKHICYIRKAFSHSLHPRNWEKEKESVEWKCASLCVMVKFWAQNVPLSSPS